jgi:hypothetical protein
MGGFAGGVAAASYVWVRQRLGEMDNNMCLTGGAAVKLFPCRGVSTQHWYLK